MKTQNSNFKQNVISVQTTAIWKEWNKMVLIWNSCCDLASKQCNCKQKKKFALNWYPKNVEEIHEGIVGKGNSEATEQLNSRLVKFHWMRKLKFEHQQFVFFFLIMDLNQNQLRKNSRRGCANFTRNVYGLFSFEILEHFWSHVINL